MKPHQQSPHQVGYQPPPSTDISPRLIIGSIVSVIALLVLCNVVFPEPVATSCPAQVASQK